MASKGNKELVERYFQAFNDHDLNAMMDFFDPNITEYPILQGQKSGIEGFKQHKIQEMALWPDGHVTVEDVIAEGDKVAFRYSFQATDRVTGKPFHLQVLAFGRIIQGKIVEVWQGVIAEHK